MKFYKISLDAIHLTSTGTSGGLPCKLEVSGVDGILFGKTGSTFPSLDGTPINIFWETSGKGKPIEIKVLTLYANVWNSLKSLIDTALENSATIELIGTGVPGDFNVSVVPLISQTSQPYTFESFANGRIRNAAFRFMTT